MITALCLNPSLDRTLSVRDFRPGETNRVEAESTVPGGKGVNVARLLSCLGAEAQALLFLPESGREAMEGALGAAGCGLLSVPLPGSLRVNLKVLDTVNARVTELNAPGLAPSKEAMDAMERLAVSAARGSRWLCLCGSLPPGCPDDYYARLTRAVKARAPGCRVALDVSGPALEAALREGPDLIKPNIEELSALCARRPAGLQEALAAAEGLLGRGAGAVMLSLGGEGAALLGEGLRLFAPALRLEVASTVGAGDAMLAGYIAGGERGLAPEEAFRLSAACAAARVAGDEKRWRDFLSRAEVRPL